MAQQVIINNCIIGYAFIERVNQISNKFSFSAYIPVDHPQLEEIKGACDSEWLKINPTGTGAAQSLGYSFITTADTKKIPADVISLMDPSKQYLLFKGTQEANTTTPIKLYDSQSTEIMDRSIIGNGTIANVCVSAFGYSTSGQKGCWTRSSATSYVYNFVDGGNAKFKLNNNKFVCDNDSSDCDKLLY